MSYLKVTEGLGPLAEEPSSHLAQALVESPNGLALRKSPAPSTTQIILTQLLCQHLQNMESQLAERQGMGSNKMEASKMAATYLRNLI
ncbi:unnamed protein product [Prunus armeniaca]|uniref:Uncharacterized protein n=1 Tax=Prunus armeniaca TaxID=36596 RepID=A0A6J5V3U4_PRUAR|nr:unnamed protein product [Prunus armeniaca]CAB4311083.1 unnamed protein product [Prunus armeniaca]